MNWVRQFLDDSAIRAGIIVGLAGLVIAFLFRWVTPGRLFNDPLPLALAFQQLLSGMLNFDWQPLLRHVLFALVLGAAAAITVRIMLSDSGSVTDAGRAGRLAAFINAGVIAVFNVDALMVLLFYVIGGAMTIFITTRAAEWSYMLLRRRGSG